MIPFERWNQPPRSTFAHSSCLLYLLTRHSFHQLSSTSCRLRVRQGCKVSVFSRLAAIFVINLQRYRVWDPEGREYIDMLSAYSYEFSFSRCMGPLTE